MATENTDFLKFNAYSIKELITRKLSEDSKFTDQIYEGSNLAILIDLVSYMYQCLVYQLNNAASESMFQDTQIYENISRLVKLIGYNPKGCKPAVFDMYIDMEDTDDERETYTLLNYSYIDTGLTDTNGKQIYFSRYNDNSTSDSGSIDIENDDFHVVKLVNGKWKLYPTIFTASGTEYETFTLSQIASDASNNQYIANDYVDVYIKRNGKFISDFHMDAEELLMGSSKNLESGDTTEKTIYKSSDRVFSFRLNENKNYEIKFGDGNICEKLQQGDLVYIFYLETNGPDGEIDVGSVDFSSIKFKHSSQSFGLTPDDYEAIFQVGSRTLLTNNNDKYQLIIKSQTTSKPENEQGVQEIKDYAPQWFKMGNRLLTRSDYEFFAKGAAKEILDVKCMNNWEYLATFYKWLYNCGIKYHQNSKYPGRYYFEESRFLLNGFQMVDAADANNLYLWIKSKDNSDPDDLRSKLDNAGLNNLKTLTTEIQVVTPITMMFDICAGYQDVAQLYAQNGQFELFLTQATNDSYIEITIDDNCIYVNSYIKERIKTIFNKYFAPFNCKIGQNIKLSDIVDEIYSINGVTRIRTVFRPSLPYTLADSAGLTYPERAIDGISLISFSNNFIEYGEDVQIGGVVRHIEDFQFPEFNESTINTIEDKVKIIKKQLTNISNIKF